MERRLLFNGIDLMSRWFCVDDAIKNSIDVLSVSAKSPFPRKDFAPPEAEMASHSPVR